MIVLLSKLGSLRGKHNCYIYFSHALKQRGMQQTTRGHHAPKQPKSKTYVRRALTQGMSPFFTAMINAVSPFLSGTLTAVSSDDVDDALLAESPVHSVSESFRGHAWVDAREHPRQRDYQEDMHTHKHTPYREQPGGPEHQNVRCWRSIQTHFATARRACRVARLPATLERQENEILDEVATKHGGRMQPS